MSQNPRPQWSPPRPLYYSEVMEVNQDCSPGDVRSSAAPTTSYGPDALDLLEASWSSMEPATSISPEGKAGPLAGVRNEYSPSSTEPTATNQDCNPGVRSKATSATSYGSNDLDLLEASWSSMPPAASISPGEMARPLAGMSKGDHNIPDYSSPSTEPSSLTPPTPAAEMGKHTTAVAQGNKLQQSQQQQQQQSRKVFLRKTSRPVLLVQSSNKPSVPEGEQCPGPCQESLCCSASSVNGARRRPRYEAATVATVTRSLTGSSGRRRDVRGCSMKQDPTQSLSLPSMRKNLARAARASKVGTKSDPVTLYWQRHELEKRNKSCRLARSAKEEKARFEVGGVRASIPSRVLPWR